MVVAAWGWIDGGAMNRGMRIDRASRISEIGLTIMALGFVDVSVL